MGRKSKLFTVLFCAHTYVWNLLYVCSCNCTHHSPVIPNGKFCIKKSIWAKCRSAGVLHQTKQPKSKTNSPSCHCTLSWIITNMSLLRSLLTHHKHLNSTTVLNWIITNILILPSYSQFKLHMSEIWLLYFCNYTWKQLCGQLVSIFSEKVVNLLHCSTWLSKLKLVVGNTQQTPA